MEIPLAIFAGIYFILFCVWIVFTLFNVYHIMRYGHWTKTPIVLLFVYLGLAIAIVVATGIALRDIDWSETVSLSIPEISVPDALPSSVTNSIP